MPARKDAEREEARRLRAEGLSVKKIAARLGVAASSVSVWTRDVAPPPKPPRPPKPAGRPRTLPAPPVPGAPTKLCGSCDRYLPLAAFNRAGDGHQHWCRDCFVDYFRERGDRHRQQSGAAKAERRALAQRFVREHLVRHPCVDCGEDDIVVLEFDHHREDKTETIARLVGAGARLERLREEVAKCEVVCANCHRQRTAKRAGWFRVTGIPASTWAGPQHRNAAFVVEVLRASGCCDCGEDDPIVLDFDHVGEKRGNVSRIALDSSLATLRAEIECCVIRCANCHRLRTLNERRSWRSVDHWAAALHSNPSTHTEN